MRKFSILNRYFYRAIQNYSTTSSSKQYPTPMETKTITQQVLQENPKVFDAIVELLKARKITQYSVLEHQVCKTSEESALIRNTPLGMGAKTMIITKKSAAKSAQPELIMLIYPADKKLSWSKVKQVESIGKKFERADEEVVEKAIGIKQGGIPPFPGLLRMSGYIHRDIYNNEQIAFNAGMRTKSIIMNTKDLPAESLQVVDICE